MCFKYTTYASLGVVFHGLRSLTFDLRIRIRTNGHGQWTWKHVVIMCDCLCGADPNHHAAFILTCCDRVAQNVRTKQQITKCIISLDTSKPSFLPCSSYCTRQHDQESSPVL